MGIIDKFWDICMDLSLKRLKRLSDKDTRKRTESNDSDYEEWLKSEGYVSAQELTQCQIRAFEDATNNKHTPSEMFADWGL